MDDIIYKVVSINTNMKEDNGTNNNVREELKVQEIT